ncbi:hypothetical protein BDD12DRAFT_919125 [Trichophaea hybrida]|nr:hypothetical protein BDD12DRAFT_919125 [Trichophaea hybrida]
MFWALLRGRGVEEDVGCDVFGSGFLGILSNLYSPTAPTANLRTSGQYEPLFDKFTPFSEFPKEITGPTAWERSNFVDHLEKWELFSLPTVGQFLSTVREGLRNGKGFILFKGFLVDQWGLHKSVVAYMGIDTHIGYFIYRTNARLLCISRTLSGGESDVVSSHRLFNVLQRTRLDVVETLTKPNWYFDLRGAVASYYNGRVVTKWDPYYVTSLSRFSDVGLVPGLSVEQMEALRVLEEIYREEALHIFVMNNFMFHARTEYIDPAPPAPRRHLMRLWLSTPERKGSWKLPFLDSERIKWDGI